MRKMFDEWEKRTGKNKIHRFRYHELFDEDEQEAHVARLVAMKGTRGERSVQEDDVARWWELELRIRMVRRLMTHKCVPGLCRGGLCVAWVMI